jgi:hypothetical protein
MSSFPARYQQFVAGGAAFAGGSWRAKMWLLRRNIGA